MCVLTLSFSGASCEDDATFSFAFLHLLASSDANGGADAVGVDRATEGDSDGGESDVHSAKQVDPRTKVSCNM